MKIVIANDHAAIRLKHDIVEYLKDKAIVTDLGAQAREGLDYPDYARRVTDGITSGQYDMGILVCGTGAGMCMSANKVNGIRAVVCSDSFTARMARAHNDANIICMGERVVGDELAKVILDEFLNTPFEGGRHAGRVAKIMAFETAND